MKAVVSLPQPHDASHSWAIDRSSVSPSNRNVTLFNAQDDDALVTLAAIRSSTRRFVMSAYASATEALERFVICDRPIGNAPVLKMGPLTLAAIFRYELLFGYWGALCPRSQRMSLWFSLHDHNIPAPDFLSLLRELTRQTRQPIIRVCDRLNVHRSTVKRLEQQVAL